MARISEHHRVLTNGVGKCSVPMWSSGCPDGFCDRPAFGERPDGPMFRDAWTGVERRQDGKYSGYVPGLACPQHGGPKEPNHFMACNTCGDDFDMRELGQVLEHEQCTPKESPDA